jgi:hypothetical protein
MTLEEIKKKESELNEELEKLSEMRAKLEQEKFKEKIGKYFRFNVESTYNGYIKITAIWGAPNYVIEGIWFSVNASVARGNNYMFLEGYKQFHIRHKVTSWNDFHLTEISEEEFKKIFNKAIDVEKKIFSAFL